MFHRFLRQRTQDVEKRRLWNQQAAKYYRSQGDQASAIYHLLKAEDQLGAAELLASYGRQLIGTGRLDTLAAYLDDLPPETFHHNPVLLTYLGDLARLHSRFEEALKWYKQAENALP